MKTNKNPQSGIQQDWKKELATFTRPFPSVIQVVNNRWGADWKTSCREKAGLPRGCFWRLSSCLKAVQTAPDCLLPGLSPMSKWAFRMPLPLSHLCSCRSPRTYIPVSNPVSNPAKNTLVHQDGLWWNGYFGLFWVLYLRVIRGFCVWWEKKSLSQHTHTRTHTQLQKKNLLISSHN